MSLSNTHAGNNFLDKMDRSDRLKASTGELDVLSSELNSDYGWGETRPKARHLYEGTDSEEESEVIDRKQTKKSQENNFDLDQHFETQLHVRDDPGVASWLFKCVQQKC